MIISFGTIELRVFSIIKGQYNLNEDLNEVTVYFVMISRSCRVPVLVVNKSLKLSVRIFYNFGLYVLILFLIERLF